VEVDAAQVTQALLNLVTNAMDAMPEGGVLTLSAQGADGALELAIADTGVGIAPEELRHVFDPLYTTKPAGKGTGLGLSIVRDVAAAHGGGTRISSQRGIGTTVVLRFPMPMAAAAHG
jgi:signal transduction histidine kinase